MRKVKIYEVKSGSAENAKKLMSDDNDYFYWNNAKFLGNNVGDIVFIVNRRANWVCLSEISQKDITAKQDRANQISSFSFRNKNYSVSDPDGVYNVFIEFKLKEKNKLPSGWNWTKQLGQSETYDLVKEGIQGQTERISKIDDLVKVFKSGEGNNILKEVLEFLKSGKSTTQPKNQANIKFDKTESEMNILTAIKTKPFILLAGISGTGKSRLVRTLAFKSCPPKLQDEAKKKPGNFELIPVRPNWHDSSELMGYVSRINGEKYITTSFLKFIAKAWKHTDVPFFLCLDEMNLAPVEQYFAEYLSIIETRQVKNGQLVTDHIISKESFENQKLYTDLIADLGLNESEFSEGISIPSNLIVIGTVNMDETTHSFSRKVLDRAMTFEMNNVDLTAGLDLNKEDWNYPKSDDEHYKLDDLIGKYTSGAEVFSQDFKEKNEVIGFLKKINNELDGTPFKIAYRVRDEFLIYCFYASQNKTADWLINALDEMTSMKILSRIEGDETKTGKVLTNLQRIITTDYKKSNAKIKEMETRLQSNGYTSFWS